jgi:hypothetical protein
MTRKSSHFDCRFVNDPSSHVFDGAALPLHERHPALPVRLRDDVIAIGEPAGEDRHRQRILDQPLDRPLQRARAVRGIEPVLGREVDRDLPVGEQVSADG